MGDHSIDQFLILIWMIIVLHIQVFLGNHRQERCAPIAVLFSGGLDSMIISALLHQCIDSECKYSFK